MARFFDDSSSECLYNNSAPISDEPLTLTCWALTDDVTQDSQTPIAINRYSGGNSGVWRIVFDRWGANPTWTCGKQNDSWGTSGANCPTAVVEDQWHHIAAVFTSDTSRHIIVDNANKTTDTTNITDFTPQRISIGAWARSSVIHEMSGAVAEAAIYNVALTDDEVAALASGVSPLFVRPQNLIAYWPLISTDNDWIGGYHLTVESTPTWTDHAPVIYSVTPVIFVPAAAAGPVTVSANTASLTAQPQASNLSPGAVTITGNLATLTTSPQAATLSPGAVSITVNAATLAAASQAASLIPGAVAVSQNLATLSAAAQAATLAPGGVSISFNVADLTAAAQAMSVVPGATSIAAAVATLSAQAQSAGIGVGIITVAMNTATLSALSQSSTLVPGAVSISQNLATLSAQAQAGTLVPGAVSLSMSLAELTAMAQAATISNPSAGPVVAAALATLSAVAQAGSVSPGAVDVSMAVADLVAAALGSTVAITSVMIDIIGTDALAAEVTGTDALAATITGSDTVS